VNENDVRSQNRSGIDEEPATPEFMFAAGFSGARFESDVVVIPSLSATNFVSCDA
jgi:hypothetical protein